MNRPRILSIALTSLFTAATALAAPPAGLSCTQLTQANANASAGAPNINHDGTPIAGTPAPDISKGFGGIPRSAQPLLTASQQRIWECTYHFPEANADMPYTLFIPTSYDPAKPASLVVDLHGLNITPLQQILFDGTTDFAEKYNFIVLAPMGLNPAAGWGTRPGAAVETAQTKPGGDAHYTAGELSELDAMTVLKLIREKLDINSDRIFLMGHSLGGAGTYYIGGKYNDIWAGLAPLSGAGGIANAAAAERYKAIPMLIMHGDKDSIVPVVTSRRAVLALQEVGAPHVYLEFPGMDHEFWIRRGAEHMEKVFLFFSMLSKKTNPGFITPEMAPPPPPRPAGAGRGQR
ncbi:MAG TPA: prolyl oligopeptidase family serine peptidase [Bryobacteraceae bacterium]|nr:prolyl oligopeptidase family serine peptidase [Bryobacteraceae bacterium]